jgi:hypothetical protein
MIEGDHYLVGVPDSAALAYEFIDHHACGSVVSHQEIDRPADKAHGRGFEKMLNY